MSDATERLFAAMDRAVECARKESARIADHDARWDARELELGEVARAEEARERENVLRELRELRELRDFEG